MVSTPETTTLDLIHYTVSIGGIGRAAETIRLMTPLMRVRQLREMHVAENELASAQRLGHTFTWAGVDKLAKALADWLPQFKKECTNEWY